MVRQSFIQFFDINTDTDGFKQFSVTAGGFYDDQGKIGVDKEAPGKDGFYWTLTPSGSPSAYYMYIHKVYVSGRGRSNSLSIRAVLNEEDE